MLHDKKAAAALIPGTADEEVKIMEYNYLENVTADVKDYIKENYDIMEDLEDLDRDSLYDELWIADSVTGNASGSYTCNTWQAEEYIAHNWDLIEEAFDAFGCDSADLGRGAEYIDVTIRCYLLDQAIDAALEELEEEKDEEVDA